MNKVGRVSEARSLWILVFAFMLMLVSAVPVIAESPEEEPGSPSRSALNPSEYPTDADIAKGIKQAELESAEEEARLASEPAVDERVVSRTAFTDVSASEAQMLLHDQFPDLLAKLNGDPARFITDATVERVLPGGTEAQVTSDGSSELLSAGIPLRATDDGELQKIDLTLNQNGDQYEPENPLTDLQIPNLATGAIQIGSDGLKVRPTGTFVPSSGELFGDKNVFYAEAARDTDLFVSPISQGVEIFAQLRSPMSPEVLRFSLDLPQGSMLRQDGNGGADVVRDQEILAHVSFPTAADAQGADVDVSLTVDGSDIVMSVPHGALDVAYPILVDPSIDADWVNSSWYAGKNTWPLDSGLFFKYQNSISYIYGATGCMYTCWGSGRGLYVTTPNSSFGANQFGQWIYAPPGGPTAGVTSYLLNPFWRDNHGCSTSSYPHPHDYDGLWNGVAWTKIFSDRAQTAGNASVYGSWSKAVIFGLGTGPGTQIPCWRDLMAGGMAVWISDEEPPSWSATPSIADQWVDTSALPISVSASDPGLGMKSFGLWTTNSGGAAVTKVGSASHSCSGFNDSVCPSSWSSTISNYSVSSLPNGVNSMVAFAYDAVGEGHNSQGKPIFVKVDHSVPTISTSGGLFAGGVPDFKGQVTATDGSAASLASAQSGMKSVEFFLDGNLAGRYPESSNPPACSSIQQGINIGSCQFQIQFELPRSTSGKHGLRIVAKDSLNHVAEKTETLNLPVDVTKPSLTTSGSLYAAADGWIGNSTASVNVEALDTETGVTKSSLYIDGSLVAGPSTQECFSGGCSLKKTFNVSLGGYSAGVHAVKITASDGAGNVAEASWSVNVDPAAPPAPTLEAPGVPSDWTPQIEDFNLNFAASDAHSGVKKIDVIVPAPTGSVTSTPYLSSCAGTIAKPCQASVTGSINLDTKNMAEGHDQVLVKAYDAVGKVSSAGELDVFVDRTSPDIGVDGELFSETGLVGLVTDLSLQVQDGGSGVASLDLMLDGEDIQTIDLEEIEEDGGEQECVAGTCDLTYDFEPIVGEAETPGGHTFSIAVHDKAGHTAVGSNEVVLDTRPPDVTVSGSLVDAIGEELSASTGSLDAIAEDGAGEFDAGIASIDIEVDGVPVNPTVDEAVLVVDESSNRIQRFTKDGEFIDAFGGPGSEAGQLNRPTALAVDGSGDVLVADTENNRIQKFSQEGDFLLEFGEYGSEAGQFVSPEGVAVDSKGNIWVADTYNLRLQKFNESGELIGAVGEELLGWVVPTAIAVGPEDSLWVADWMGGRVVVLNSEGELEQEVGSYGLGNGQFVAPRAIAIDSAGVVWVGDEGSNRVQGFDLTGKYLTRFGSQGTGKGQFNFGSTVGIDVDPEGGVWVTDGNNHRVQKWAEPTPNEPPKPPSYTSSFGVSGSGDGQLNKPGDIAHDAQGNLWVVDRAGNRVQKFDQTGKFLAKFGSLGSGNGQFNRPTSIAIDTTGNLWVADASNNRIQKFDSTGKFIKAVGSSGTGNGQFSGPEGIATDAKGNVWVADTYNRRVQKFNQAGEFLFKFGSYGTGPGQFGEANSIDIGPSGNVWVADWQNNRVAKFTESGQFVLNFGSQGSGNGQFNQPDAVEVDSQGNVWVGDQNNSRVQRFDEAGQYIGQFGSKGTGAGQFSLTYPMGIALDNNGAIWVTDVNNNRIQRWTFVDDGPAFVTEFGSYGKNEGQFDHPSDIAFASTSTCEPAVCPSSDDASYLYSQSQWGTGVHSVVVTATDAAGNASAEEIKVNDPITTTTPSCPEASTETLSGGETLSVGEISAAINNAVPSALAATEPFKEQPAAESPEVAELEPEVTREPEGVSLNEMGIDVNQTMTGGGVSDIAGGSFTVGQAACLQPLQKGTSADSPKLTNGSAVLYPNALPDTDTVVRPTAFGTTIVEHRRGSASPDEFKWAVGLNEGEELVELSNGGVAVVVPEGPDTQPAEVPVRPEEPAQYLNDTTAQVNLAEHDLALADEELEGKVELVVAPPEVLMANGEVIPGLLRIMGATVIVAELPPGTVAQAEALIIQANPPAEPLDICAAIAAEDPQHAAELCKEFENAPETEDSGDELGLYDLATTPSGSLNSALKAGFIHFEKTSYPGGAQASSGSSGKVSNQQERFCKPEKRKVECREFFVDGYQAALAEEVLFNVSGSDSTRANTFRHSFWVALMRLSEDYEMDGLAWAIAHEEDEWKSKKPTARKNSRMDVLNNLVGYNRAGGTETASCVAMKAKSTEAHYIGTNWDPFRWANAHDYEYFRGVYRKLRDLGRAGATGLTILSSGKGCAAAGYD